MEIMKIMYAIGTILMTIWTQWKLAERVIMKSESGEYDCDKMDVHERNRVYFHRKMYH
jgi:hypothetical protein